jgi:flagellar assembly protein FliH
MTSRPFAFETEFTADGEIIGAPESGVLSRREAEAAALAARQAGEAAARLSSEARAHAACERIARELVPAAARLAELAVELRREAAELALIAARRIAGAALDRTGTEAAADAVARLVAQLRAEPEIVVAAPPEALDDMRRLLERATPGHAPLRFVADPAARPGDWRVEWRDGAVSFDRARVEAEIAALVEARLAEPVDPAALRGAA